MSNQNFNALQIYKMPVLDTMPCDLQFVYVLVVDL